MMMTRPMKTSRNVLTKVFHSLARRPRGSAIRWRTQERLLSACVANGPPGCPGTRRPGEAYSESQTSTVSAPLLAVITNWLIPALSATANTAPISVKISRCSATDVGSTPTESNMMTAGVRKLA